MKPKVTKEPKANSLEKGVDWWVRFPTQPEHGCDQVFRTRAGARLFASLCRTSPDFRTACRAYADTP